MQHLVGLRGLGAGPYLESWPKYVFLFLLVVVVAGTIAIWNRSRYRP